MSNEVKKTLYLYYYVINGFFVSSNCKLSDPNYIYMSQQEITFLVPGMEEMNKISRDHLLKTKEGIVKKYHAELDEIDTKLSSL